MSTATYATVLKAAMTTDGRRIFISAGPTIPPALAEFILSMPACVKGRQPGTWTCQPTPAAAWRLLHERGDWAVKAGSQVEALAASFKVDPATDETQPRMYNKRSWRHQALGYNFAYGRPATMFAMGMGTGKSKPTVDLAVNWGCRLTLVLCPKSVLGVWRREFEQWAAVAANVCILDKGTTAKKRDIAAGHLMLCEHLRQPAVVVTNYDSVWREPFGKWSVNVPWDLVICDESHRIKAHNSQVSKHAAKLGAVAARRLCLTGTPMPHSPLDLFGQFRFLDPGIFGTSWHWFSHRYARHDNPHVPQMVTSYANQDELQRRMAWITYRVGNEVLDLPEVTHNVLACQLSPAAMKNYRDLEDEMITEVQAGVVTVANALVRLLRLQQVTSGFLQADDAEIPTEIDTAKRDVLSDLLEDIGKDEPVVVFCNFRHDLAAIAAVAKKLGRTYGEVSGARKDLTSHATMPDGVQVMGVQVRAGGLGIDLTRARYAVYYNHPWSLGDYEQSVARVHRPGQTRHTFYYHLVAENTVDEHVQRSLEKKRDAVESILSIFKQGGEV